jgi:hypothetical protein
MSTKTSWRVGLFQRPPHPPPASARETPEPEREREESRRQQTAHTGPLGKDEAWHLRRTQISKRNYQVNLVRTLNYPYKLYFE